MSQSQSTPAIYLIIEFAWPQPFEPAHGRAAFDLHQAITQADWVEESVAASGGIGGDLPSLWVFKLASYSQLDRLLRHKDDPVAQAYRAFFSQMAQVRDRVREEVLFIEG